MAQSLKPRVRRLAVVVAAAVSIATALGTGPAVADTSPGPSLPKGDARQPAASCLREQYPHAGAARNSASVPYEIPFTATLGDPVHHKIGGGYLQISHGPLTFTLGGPKSLIDGSGSITASACGLVNLPNQVGGISGSHYGAPGNGNRDRYNNNFIFDNSIPVSAGLAGVPGIDLLESYASADGELGASIDPTPAANGGLNVEFEASAKATAVLTVGALRGIANLLGPDVPAALLTLLAQLASLAPTVPLPGGECTVPIGNLLDAGLPSTDLGSVTKLTGADNTNAVHLTTRTSGTMTGQPVTGPITGAQAILVSNDFPVAAIDPNTPPSPDAPGANQTPSTLCTPSNASLFNSLLDLPSPAGDNVFYAPGTFAVFTSS